MAQDRGKDRHKAKWHTQIRDIPPEVWARVKAGATSRYIQDDGKVRPLNVGEYLTRCVLLVETVREAAQEANSEDEFYKRVIETMEQLGLEAVYA